MQESTDAPVVYILLEVFILRRAQMSQNQQTLELIEKNKRLKETIRDLQRQLNQKNRELDILHYVWCSGGCESGTHRFFEDKVYGEITEGLIVMGQRNLDRLRSWHHNNKNKKNHGP
jgi:hypothetical protein